MNVHLISPSLRELRGTKQPKQSKRKYRLLRSARNDGKVDIYKITITNKRRKMRKNILTMFCILSAPLLFAQSKQATEFSLKQCVQTAVEHNIKVRSARYDKQINGYKVDEYKAKLLPTVTVTGGFQDNIQLPTTMVPGEFLGEPGTMIPLQLGAPYSTSANANISLVLYNQTALMALKLSKKSDEISNLSLDKACEDVANNAASLFFLTLTTIEQEKIIGDNIDRTKRISDVTKLLVDNGMSKQVDYDRINVNLENLYTQQSNTQAAIDQQMDMLRYMMDIPNDTKINLTGDADTPLLAALPEHQTDFSNLTDIKMLESQRDMSELNYKVNQAGYYPTLSFSGQYSYQGLRSKFGNYFNNSLENRWFPASYLAVNLSIPVFDGFEKRSKGRQAKLDIMKAEATLSDTKQLYEVNYQDALNTYNNNKTNVDRQKINIALAEKVYDETALKYKEGMSGLTNLLQDQMSLSSAQSSYLSALYNLKTAELKLMTLTGNINQLYNN
jgi:outer membrane protein TolC